MEVDAGSILRWEVWIENTGDVSLAGFFTFEDQGSGVLFDLLGGDPDGDESLGTNEVWSMALEQSAGVGEQSVQFLLEALISDTAAMFQRRLNSSYVGLTGVVGGYVWWDDDTDELRDAAEPGVSNVTVQLLRPSGDLVATQLTDSDGEYLFEGVVPGAYRVSVEIDPADDNTSLISDSPVNVHVSGTQDAPDVHFALFRRSKVQGEVWGDLNMNFEPDDLNLSLVGLSVLLFEVVEGEQRFKEVVHTGPGGLYEFPDLEPGAYEVVLRRGDVLEVQTRAVVRSEFIRMPVLIE